MENKNYQVSRRYPLFEHMYEEHGLTLLEDQLWQIERIVLEMHGINPETSAESIERQYKEKGNQLDQVYGAIKEPSNSGKTETIAQQLGIKDFPFEVMDKEGRLAYHETVNGFWSKSEYDFDGNKTYYANSNGYVEGWQYDSDGNVIYYWNNEGLLTRNINPETCKESIKDPSNDDQMKTAMQELIDKLNNVEPTQYCSIETIRGWAESLLGKEKEQMEDAFVEGSLSWATGTNSEHYYNKTYGEKK